VQIEGTQPLAGEQVARVLLRDPDLNPCFISQGHVFPISGKRFAPRFAPMTLARLQHAGRIGGQCPSPRRDSTPGFASDL
jgi:hypothetical protein